MLLNNPCQRGDDRGPDIRTGNDEGMRMNDAMNELDTPTFRLAVEQFHPEAPPKAESATILTSTSGKLPLWPCG